MKHLLLIIIFFVACIGINAQQREFQINDKVYVYDSISKKLFNKQNTMGGFKNECLNFSSIDKVTSFYPQIVEVFSDDRITYFMKNKCSILMNTIFDLNGIIKEVYFNFYNIAINEELIKEISLLENKIIGHKINFKSQCSEQKFFKLAWAFNFKRIKSSFEMAD